MEGFDRVVLVVEDDPGLQRSMVKCLEEARFKVEATLDCETAVQYLSSKERPSLVCVDLALPRESGFQLCEHIRRTPQLLFVPILVTSDRVSPEDMAHAEEAGANAFLKKPFTMRQLLKYVLALLDGPHSSRPSVRRLRTV